MRGESDGIGFLTKGLLKGPEKTDKQERADVDKAVLNDVTIHTEHESLKRYCRLL